jgi:hypothetical protein
VPDISDTPRGSTRGLGPVLLTSNGTGYHAIGSGQQVPVHRNVHSLEEGVAYVQPLMRSVNRNTITRPRPWHNGPTSVAETALPLEIEISSSLCALAPLTSVSRSGSCPSRQSDDRSPMRG